MLDFLGKYSDDYKDVFIEEENKIIKIYSAHNIKYNRLCKLKVFNKAEMKMDNYDFWLENIKREEQHTKICKSKNVIELYQKFETNGFYIFEFEYYEHSLYKETVYRNGAFKNKRDKTFFRQIILDIANALKIMHEHGIMHRNINPYNIFINDYKFNKCNTKFIKLGNFASSIFIEDNISDTAGCIYYAAPEILKNLQYNERCDLWSLGVTLYELYFVIPPYYIDHPHNLYDIMDFIYAEKLLIDKSGIPSIDILFRRLLVREQDERMSFDEFFDFVFDKNFMIDETAFLQSKPKYLKLYDSILKEEEYRYMERSCNEGCFYYKERIIASVKNEFFPGINKLPNVYNNEGKVEEVFNNIIYYNDNIEVDEDIDYFERITPGAFIPCSNLISLELIKNEILYYIRTTKKTIFNLIIKGNACEKIMGFLNSNNDFKRYINKICIYSSNLDKWLFLKHKYNEIIYDFSNNRLGIKDFIKKISSKDIKPYPVKKLITYNDYTNRYKNIHEKISEFYGTPSIEDYLTIIDKKIKSIKNETIENIQRKNENLDISEFINFDIEGILSYLERIIYQNQSNILNSDLYSRRKHEEKLAYEKVNFLTSRMMIYLNKHNFKPFYEEDKTILRRGIKIPYSSLLPYIRAVGKIITFLSFILTREKEITAKNYSGRNQSNEQYKTCKIFSVIFTITNNYHKNWISNCFILQENSENHEEDIIFQPFTFFLVKKVDIDTNNYTADIYLETIGKTEILEEKIKIGKSIVYNEKEKIMEVIN